MFRMVDTGVHDGPGPPMFNRDIPGMPRSLFARAVTLLAWLVTFAVVGILLQRLASVPMDADSGYHIAVARLLRTHGVLTSFPWTRFSWLADHYADKEFLFHVLLIPLASLDWVEATHIAGSVLAAGLLATIYFLLRVEKVPWAGVWAFFPLAASGYFVVRLALVRPHLVAIILALVVTWAAARRRLAILAIASFLYPLSYTAWHAALILVVIVEVAALLVRERPDWRPLAVTVTALAIGLLVHPNFPHIIELFWIQNVQVLVETAWLHKVGFDLGVEFQAFPPAEYAIYAGIPLLTTVAAGLLVWRARDRTALAFTLAALAWAIMAARTARFIEYLVPFATVAAALAAGRLSRPRIAVLVSLVVGLAVTLTLGRSVIELLPHRTRYFPTRIEAPLRTNIPEGARVFTCSWDLTGEMMAVLPERRFLVALDPVFFYRQHPDKYRLWYEMIHRPPAHPASLVRDVFDSEYVLCEHGLPAYRAFAEALARDPDAHLLWSDALWAVFRISLPHQQSADNAFHKRVSRQ